MSQISLGLIAGAIGIPMIVIDIWLIYVVCMYTDKAESLLSNSDFVEANRSAYSKGRFIGKVMRNGFLTVVLMMPALCAKRGILNISDAKNFPGGLKWLLFFSWGAGVFIFVVLVLFGIYIKFQKVV
jgi:hypothetical protein